MRIPQWFLQYKDRIIKSLPKLNIIETYCVAHDLGKAFCLTIDENGKRHYPDHAEISYNKWLELSDDIEGKQLIATLIRNDMLFHAEDAETIHSKKLSSDVLCTLLLSALAALHANAKSFGSIESDSFKIKFKKLEKRAKVLLHDIFDHPYVYVVVRNDLSQAQKVVQSGHALIEATKNFNMNGSHPSVIVCVVRNENKLHSISAELSQKKIKHSKFFEPDINNQLTAIASEPLYGSDRLPFKRFQLLH